MTLRPSPTAIARPDGPATRERHRPVWPHALAVVVPLAVLGGASLALYLAGTPWGGAHRSHLALGILNIPLFGGVAVVVLDAIAIALAAALLIRPLRRGWLIRAGVGLVSGAVVGIAVYEVANATNAFGVELVVGIGIWSAVALAGVGLAVASLIQSTPWRKAVAVVGIAVFALVGTVGVNAAFGLDNTVAELFGTSTAPVVALPAIPQPKATSTPPPLLDGGALWANWQAPAGMPGAGSVSQVVIPNTASGFHSRPAGLYLPPAALVPNPPALPFMLMMMGQPGNPDPSFEEAILDQMAAAHRGLAPIVLVVDQLGNPSNDTLCLNTATYGNVETFVTQDAVAWARTHLHILQDPAHWTVAGYSDGGECALSFGVKYPNLWGNVLDISGELYPGSDRSAQTLATVFHGDRAAYEAQYPLTIMASHTYTDMDGIFTVGSNDYGYRTQAQTAAAATQAAGWTTTYFEVPNGGHVLAALNGGLAEGFSVLYPRLGLSNPNPDELPVPRAPSTKVTCSTVCKRPE